MREDEALTELERRAGELLKKYAGLLRDRGREILNRIEDLLDSL